MLDQGQWVVITYSVEITLPGLGIIPYGFKEEGYRRPQCMGKYTFLDKDLKNLL